MFFSFDLFISSAILQQKEGNIVKLIRVKDYNDLSKKASEILLKKVKNSQFLTLGLPTGSTPIGLYKLLVQDFLRSYTTYEHVTTFNLDEYIGLKPNHPNSYAYFMNKHLFHHIDIPVNQIFIPSGITENPINQCDEYEEQILSHGGIDLLFLGIGSNGHIGFNEPGTPFTSRTHVVNLDEKTIIDNSRFFKNINDVPKQAITMGLETIMTSKEIILLVSGKSKAEIMKALLDSEPSENLPASILKTHHNVTIIADESSLSLID